MRRVPLFILLLLCCSTLSGSDGASNRAAEILRENCLTCHGSSLKMSNLDLRTRKTILQGGERGAAVVPNYPEKSRLYRFVSHQQNPTMPPGSKLADQDIETLRRWILAGALLEKEESQEELDGKAALAALEERPITEEERQFWAFQPPKAESIPEVADRDWVRNPVDAFLLARMEAQGLRPMPPADRRTLIRRSYLDLHGLPPDPEEVEKFVHDSSPDAYERLIDRLLASPHYGERWARHWMDVVRYADSGGYEFDRDRPNAWRYRDYVVDALNSDKPYDQFIREQLAGDEITPESDEAMIATGFIRLHPENNIKNERTRMDELDDIISTTSLTFLGMTLGCARCHNHKFDPIPQKDYYRIQSIFYSTKPVAHPLVPPEVVERFNQEKKRIDDAQDSLREAKRALEDPYRDRLYEEEISRLPEYMQAAWRTPAEERTEGQRLNARQIRHALQAKIKEEKIVSAMTETDREKHQGLVAQIEEWDKERPEPFVTAMAIGEHGREALPSFFLHRGDPSATGSRMSPGVFSVASSHDVGFPSPPETARSSWRRRTFAEWIASPENPLTARVMVNRIWQNHFGEGIVRTPSNFGRTGQMPSHPEVLDWLALRFIKEGWSVKAMHRLLMRSNAYRMSSDDDPANLKVDPENRFFWRMPRQRLEAEIVRDSVLAVAGSLDRKVGGPGIFPFIDPSLFQASSKRTWPGLPDDDPATWRRSLYVFSKRTIRYPLFEAFDQPDMSGSVDRRNRSTTAPQALLLMNNNFVLVQAKRFAARVRREAGEDMDSQVERTFRLALGRSPSAAERARSLEFVHASPSGMVDLCHALFNLNEFLYRP